jgi:hypothetical protein
MVKPVSARRPQSPLLRVSAEEPSLCPMLQASERDAVGAAGAFPLSDVMAAKVGNHPKEKKSGISQTRSIRL